LAIWKWWSKEASGSVSEDALKKAYCSAVKSGDGPLSCNEVHDAMQKLCIPGTELGKTNELYFSYCKLHYLGQQCSSLDCDK
jgi:hypothetical protein